MCTTNATRTRGLFAARLTVLTCVTFNRDLQGTKGKKVDVHGKFGFELYCPQQFCRYFPRASYLTIPFFRKHINYDSFSVSFFFHTDYNRTDGFLVSNGCILGIPMSEQSLSVVQNVRGLTTTLSDENSYGTTTLFVPVGAL